VREVDVTPRVVKDSYALIIDESMMVRFDQFGNLMFDSWPSRMTASQAH
jgi:hypothetical protein